MQAVAAGWSDTCALVNGGIWCWGSNGQGQLGDGSFSFHHDPNRVAGAASGVQVIAAGSRHNCALASGGLLCCGDDTAGQLGHGDSNTMSKLWIPVTGLSSGVQAVTAGYDHTCAIVNGGVQCWGLNSVGQVGDGSTVAMRTTPVQVIGL